MHVEDCLDLYRGTKWKTAHANRCARVAANVTKQLHKEVGTTVNNGGMITELWSRIHESIDLKDPFNST
jgi:hypothetical protein